MEFRESNVRLKKKKNLSLIAIKQRNFVCLFWEKRVEPVSVSTKSSFVMKCKKKKKVCPTKVCSLALELTCTYCF